MILKKYYKTILVFIFVLILSLTPSSTVPKVNFLNIPHIDKLVHFFMYFLLSVASFIDIKNNIKKPTRLFILSVIFIILSIGGIIEIIQANFIIGRSGSWLDLLANSFGILIGTLLFYKTPIFAKLLQDY